MDNRELRELISSNIRCGRLPSASTIHSLFGGKGDGDPCVCCSRLILSTHVQYDIACAGTDFSMHLHCYNEWRRASAALNAAPLTPPGQSPQFEQPWGSDFQPL
jgi:hypothetical protein